MVDLATIMEMAVVNTYLKKREEHRLTYKSGGCSTQVDYMYEDLPERDRRLQSDSGWDCSQATSAGVVQDNLGSQEAEDREGRTKDQMMEVEEGRLVRGILGGGKADFGRYERVTGRLGN